MESVEMVKSPSGYSVKKEVLESVKASLARTGDPRDLSAGDFYVAYKFGLLGGMLPGWKRDLAYDKSVCSLLALAEDAEEHREVILKTSKSMNRNERDAKIVSLYKEGMKPSAVAKEIGLSQARVRGILIQAGLLETKKKGE